MVLPNSDHVIAFASLVSLCLKVARMSSLASSEYNLAVGDRLAAIRSSRGLSQVEFALRLGLSPRAYQNYERGEREVPVAILRSLNSVFGISPLWVISGPQKICTPSKPSLLEEIVIAVEHHLDQRRLKLDPVRKARLIALLHEHFQLRPTLDDVELQTMLSVAA